MQKNIVEENYLTSLINSAVMLSELRKNFKVTVATRLIIFPSFNKSTFLNYYIVKIIEFC